MSVHDPFTHNAETAHCIHCGQSATVLVAIEGVSNPDGMFTPYCDECSSAVIAAGGRDYPLSVLGRQQPTHIHEGVISESGPEARPAAWLSASHICDLRDWV